MGEEDEEKDHQVSATHRGSRSLIAMAAAPHPRGNSAKAATQEQGTKPADPCGTPTLGNKGQKMLPLRCWLLASLPRNLSESLAWCKSLGDLRGSATAVEA